MLTVPKNAVVYLFIYCSGGDQEDRSLSDSQQPVFDSLLAASDATLVSQDEIDGQDMTKGPKKKKGKKSKQQENAETSSQKSVAVSKGTDDTEATRTELQQSTDTSENSGRKKHKKEKKKKHKKEKKKEKKDKKQKHENTSTIIPDQASSDSKTAVSEINKKPSSEKKSELVHSPSQTSFANFVAESVSAQTTSAITGALKDISVKKINTEKQVDKEIIKSPTKKKKKNTKEKTVLENKNSIGEEGLLSNVGELQTARSSIDTVIESVVRHAELMSDTATENEESTKELSTKNAKGVSTKKQSKKKGADDDSLSKKTDEETDSSQIEVLSKNLNTNLLHSPKNKGQLNTTDKKKKSESKNLDAHSIAESDSETLSSLDLVINSVVRQAAIDGAKVIGAQEKNQSDVDIDKVSNVNKKTAKKKRKTITVEENVAGDIRKNSPLRESEPKSDTGSCDMFLTDNCVERQAKTLSASPQKKPKKAKKRKLHDPDCDEMQENPKVPKTLEAIPSITSPNEAEMGQTISDDVDVKPKKKHKVKKDKKKKKKKSKSKEKTKKSD